MATKEQRLLMAEFNAFLLDRIALLFALIVIPATCNASPFPSLWQISLTTAFAMTPAFYLYRWLHSTTTYPPLWIERSLFLVERFLLFLSLVFVPMRPLYTLLTWVFFVVLSLCVGGVYLASYLYRVIYSLSWVCKFGYTDNYLGAYAYGGIIISKKGEEEYNEDNDIGKEEEEKNNDNNDKDDVVHINKEEEEEVRAERLRNNRKEECLKCCESEVMLRKWDLYKEELRKWEEEVVDWYQRERRKWDEEKAELVGKLSAAIATAELYRNLLHDAMVMHFME